MKIKTKNKRNKTTANIKIINRTLRDFKIVRWPQCTRKGPV